MMIKIRLDVRSMVDLTLISREELEGKMNNIIKKNLGVVIKTYSRNMIPQEIDISGVPSHIENVRIVSIGDYDVQTCENMHVSNTSEIGVYRILDIRRIGKDIYRIQGLC